MVFGWFKKDKKPAAKPAALVHPSAELSDEMHEEVKRLCSEGDQQANSKHWAAALALYWQAFDLLPEPKTQWSAGTWVLAAIGDANFLAGDFEAALDLGRTPGSISLALQKLEQRLGVPLFHRTTRKMALTEAGENLLLRVAIPSKIAGFVEPKITLKPPRKAKESHSL